MLYCFLFWILFFFGWYFTLFANGKSLVIFNNFVKELFFTSVKCRQHQWCNDLWYAYFECSKTVGSIHCLVKPKDLIFFAFMLSTPHEGVRAKTDQFGISIMCMSGATCLTEDCCFQSSITKTIPTRRVGLVQNRHHLHIIKSNLFLPWYCWKKLLMRHLLIMNRSFF